VKIPAPVVEEALKLCPHTFTQKSRNPEFDLTFEPSRVFFTNHSARYYRDMETGERRVPTLRDVQDLVTLLDALGNIHAIFVPALDVSDRPDEVALEWVVAEVFRGSQKTTIGATFGGCAKWIVEMAEVVGEDVIGCGAPVPPMNWASMSTQGIITYARANHIASPCTGIQVGISGPATIAGTLVQANAEILAAIVLAQLVRPGVRIAAATQAIPMDMRTGNLAAGSIEAGIVTACLTQIYHHYNLPIRSQFPMTDSKLPDQQTGYEKSLQLMLAAMAGNNYIISGGGIENELLMSYEQVVIDDEVYGMVGRVLRGVEVTDQTMAVELIKEVGRLGGNYLSKAHTKEWARKEMVLPTVSNRLPHQLWVKEGSKDIVERARDVARTIIQTHEVVPLPDHVDRELDKILRAAEREKTGQKG
jgi:trimethylamine--corrinoid protein Co-methyltransferase